MLVLTRKERESLTIFTPTGEVLKFVIVKMQGNRVGIGIEAPTDFKVVRTELLKEETKQ